MDILPVKRALLSVTDKSGLAEFAAWLDALGVELVSTGGTAKAIRAAGLPVTDVSRVTGFPEILGGRVKTLHPHIHAGVLADKDDPSHLRTLDELGIAPFEIICVNLYNFAEAARKNLPLKKAVEEIDIGGPTMLRAAAKNFHSVLVIPTASRYAEARADIEANSGAVSLELRRRMAAETFQLVSAYDAMIASYLGTARA